MFGEARALQLSVNGRNVTLQVDVSQTLLDVLRNDLGLTGTKECCVEGECGACTVIMDERPVNACIVLAAEADGTAVTTIEGLGGEGELSHVQDAFLEQGGVQCGFCIPGMVVSVHALLAAQPGADEAAIREGLSGNLCRCGGYRQICQAVLRAARSGR